MKKALCSIIMLLLLSWQLKAQSLDADPKTVTPQLISTSVENKTYRFESLKKITANNEDRIADRVHQSFAGIDSIQIRNQQVTISINNNVTDQTLGELFKLFGYNTYKINAGK